MNNDHWAALQEFGNVTTAQHECMIGKGYPWCHLQALKSVDTQHHRMDLFESLADC